MTEIKLTPLIDTLKLEKIDDSIYFSDKYKNYISNSRLGLLKTGGAEAFFEGFKPIYSSSLDLGSAVHEMTLQNDLFTICETIDKPTAKVGVIADKIYSKLKGKIPSNDDVCKAAGEIDYFHGLLTPKQITNVFEKCVPYWTARKRFETSYTDSKEVIFLDKRTREAAQNCITALKNNEYIQEILHPKSDFGEVISENEKAILLNVLVEIPELNSKFILRLKSKLDNYIINPMLNEIQVNDIKTLGRILSDFQINIDNYGYNRELAMYSFLLSLVAKKYYNLDNPIVKGHYLVVSTIPQYYTKVVSMTKKMFMEGFAEFKSLLKQVAYYVATDYKDFGIWDI
jgi:hypothetical protein